MAEISGIDFDHAQAALARFVLLALLSGSPCKGLKPFTSAESSSVETLFPKISRITRRSRSPVVKKGARSSLIPPFKPSAPVESRIPPQQFKFLSQDPTTKLSTSFADSKVPSPSTRPSRTRSLTTRRLGPEASWTKLGLGLKRARGTLSSLKSYTFIQKSVA